MPVELVRQGAGEGVADDEQEVDAVSLDDAPDVGGVELRGVREHEHGAAAEQHPQRDPVAGAVHERRRDQGLEAGGRLGEEAVEVGGGSGAEALDHRVGVAPQHPFRQARRATGVEDVEVVGTRRDGRWRRR